MYFVFVNLRICRLNVLNIGMSYLISLNLMHVSVILLLNVVFFKNFVNICRQDCSKYEKMTCGCRSVIELDKHLRL